MATDKQNYSEQTIQFMKQASEQNRLNRLQFNKSIMPIWKAAVAGLLFAAVVIGALAVIVYYLH